MGQNNEYRPEQMTLATILREDRTYFNFDIKTEYPVTGLTFEGKNYAAILDVAILPKKMVQTYKNNQQQPIALRMMGQIHEKDRKRLQDADQAQALANSKWFIHDLWYNSSDASYLWKPEAFTKKELEKKLFYLLRTYIYADWVTV